MKSTKLCLALMLGASCVYAGSGNKKQTHSITFTENKGQVCDQNNKPRPDILFSGTNKDLLFHLSRAGVSYQLARVDSWRQLEDNASSEKVKIPAQRTIYRVDVNWMGANLNSQIVKGEELAGCSNYYLPQCPGGILNAKTYDQITFQSIYNGIDVTWYEKEGELEYDFIVKPFASAGQIMLQIKGAERLSINRNGALEIKTPLGIIIEDSPVAFQNNTIVSAKWKIVNGAVTIELGSYDRSKELIIDPVTRKWGTFYGGAGDDYARSCRTDISGNVFLSGYTSSASSTLIATSGAHQTSYGGGALDMFVVKFDQGGVRQWATYYGGSGDDVGLASDIDGSDIYIGGYTSSTGTVIATLGSHQTSYGGNIDGFLVKFDQNGVRQWSTFYGGASTDAIYGCSVDQTSGDVYACGNAGSTTNISTPGAHQVSYTSADDAFLVKFNSAGVRQWATYYGGAQADNGYGCTVDGLGRVILVGRTASSASISTSGAHQVAIGSSNFDGFVVQFNSSGVRQWGTYYGGLGIDVCHSSICDASSNVYVIGEAASTGGIATVGAHQSSIGGFTDAFMVKFNSSGVRQWGTYYGGTTNDYGYSCSLDYYGNLLCAGTTSSSSGIATAGAHQTILGGTSDAFVAGFNVTNGQRIWGTYYGATGVNQGRTCHGDPNGYIYLGGYSNTLATGTVIATPGSHQPTKTALNDAFLVQFTDCATTTVSIAGTVTLCSGQSTTLNAIGAGFTNYLWNIGPLTSSNVVTPTLTTVYSVTAGTGPSACDATDTHTITVTQTPTISVNSTSSLICAGAQVTLNASGALGYSWSTSATTSSIIVSPTVNTTYTITGYNGACANTKTIAITMTANISMSAFANPSIICVGAQATLNANGASTFTWNTSSNSPTIVVNPSSSTTYTVDGMSGSCTGSAVVTLSVDPCAGIGELGNADGSIKLYPNPNNGSFVLSAPKGAYELINSIGQVIEIIEVSNEEIHTSLKMLPVGIYYLRSESIKLKLIITK